EGSQREPRHIEAIVFHRVHGTVEQNLVRLLGIDIRDRVADLLVGAGYSERQHTQKKDHRNTTKHKNPQTLKLCPDPCGTTATSNLLKSSFGCRFQQLPGVTGWIALTEHGVACNQNFRARSYHLDHGVKSNAAIDFNPVTQPPPLAQLGQLADFVQRSWDELLSPESRIHRHNQYVVDDIQHFAQHFDRRRGIDDDASPNTMVPD